MFSDIREEDPLWDILRIEEKGLDDRIGEWAGPCPLYVMTRPLPV